MCWECEALTKCVGPEVTVDFLQTYEKKAGRPDDVVAQRVPVFTERQGNSRTSATRRVDIPLAVSRSAYGYMFLPHSTESGVVG